MCRGINCLYQHDADTGCETIFAIEERIFPEGMRKMRDLFKEARRKGQEEGMERGIEKVTMRMFRDGIEIDSICRVTGLNREQLETVRRRHQNKNKRILSRACSNQIEIRRAIGFAGFKAQASDKPDFSFKQPPQRRCLAAHHLPSVCQKPLKVLEIYKVMDYHRMKISVF